GVRGLRKRSVPSPVPGVTSGTPFVSAPPRETNAGPKQAIPSCSPLHTPGEKEPVAAGSFSTEPAAGRCAGGPRAPGRWRSGELARWAAGGPWILGTYGVGRVRHRAGRAWRTRCRAGPARRHGTSPTPPRIPSEKVPGSLQLPSNKAREDKGLRQKKRLGGRGRNAWQGGWGVPATNQSRRTA